MARVGPLLGDETQCVFRDPRVALRQATPEFATRAPTFRTDCWREREPSRVWTSANLRGIRRRGCRRMQSSVARRSDRARHDGSMNPCAIAARSIAERTRPRFGFACGWARPLRASPDSRCRPHRRTVGDSDSYWVGASLRAPAEVPCAETSMHEAPGDAPSGRDCARSRREAATRG